MTRKVGRPVASTLTTEREQTLASDFMSKNGESALRSVFEKRDDGVCWLLHSACASPLSPSCLIPELARHTLDQMAAIRLRKTSFIEFSDRMPVSSRATLFVISSWYSR